MDLIDSVINDIINPAETSEASADQGAASIPVSRSPIPSASRRGKQAIQGPEPTVRAPASHPSASKPRTSAIPLAAPNERARSSDLSGASRGAETILQAAPIRESSSLHPSRASGADQARSCTQPKGGTPDLQSSPATGADEATPAAQTNDHAPRRQKRGRKAVSVRGPTPREAHTACAPDATNPVLDGADDGQTSIESQRPGAVVGEEPRRSPLDGASPEIVAIWADWRTRQRWAKAEKSLLLQSKAYCRGWVEDGDKEKAGKLYAAYAAGEGVDPALAALLAPYSAAIALFAEQRNEIEKSLRKTARKLPVYPWVKSTFGACDSTLAAIVGEAGNVGSYKSVSALWKRLGLAVFDGNRQGNTAGAENKAKTFVEHGYSPVRRSVVWNIGNGLIGGMGRGPRLAPGEDPSARDDLSPYQKLFVERIRYEAERDPAHRRPDTTKKDTGEVRESFSKHAANRAKRYVEKRFLRDLYAAWRAADGQPSAATHRRSAIGGETPA